VAQHIQDVMTKHVHCVGEGTTLREVARVMRDQQIGDVLVTGANDRLVGIITDRDLVVRAVAEGKDFDRTRAADICSGQIVTITPTATIDEAVELMRTKAVRRIPVVDHDKPVGIVSIGDLALDRDPRSALADISAAPANN
jgi:CBS domain-containing protein